MISFFPRKLASKGIIVYCIALIATSIIFYRFTLPIKYIIIGVSFIIGFFTLSSLFSKKWAKDSKSIYAQKLFWTALVIRIIWVIFSYFFFVHENNGFPFEFQPSDGPGYHNACSMLCTLPWKQAISTLRIWSPSISDWGYQLWLILIYKIFGPNIIITRIFKSIISSFSCVLLYKLASRNIGEGTGKLSGIFCMLMPNLIMYCGMHLKETEMIFLILAFLERADNLFRNEHFSLWSVIYMLLLILALFSFRTVLGVISFFSILTALLFYKGATKGTTRKIIITIWVIVGLVSIGGGTIATEVEGYWEERITNQQDKRSMQTSRGNQWAQYATGAVLAPMIFIMPFSTLVDMEQYNQELTHGGNFVRNYMGIFVLFALYYSIIKTKKWRDFSLIGSFLFAYLGVIAFSGYGNSERFLLPGAPLLMILAAYGISLLNPKNIKYVNLWGYIVVLMEFGWAFFKVGSRGLF